MPKKPVKTDPGQPKRLQAQDLYLQSRGKMQYQDIAKAVGANRMTISRWAKQDGWAALLGKVTSAVADRVQERVTAQVSKTLADKIAESYEQTVDFFGLLDQAAAAKMVKRDNDGNPVRNADGKLVVNDGLTCNDLRCLGTAKSIKVKTFESIHQAIVQPQGKKGSELEAVKGQEYDQAMQREFQRLFREPDKSIDADPQRRSYTAQAQIQSAMMTMLQAASDVRAIDEGRLDEVVLLKPDTDSAEEGK